MPHPATITFNDDLAKKSSESKRESVNVFSRENPNPNSNFLVNKSTGLSATNDSFRIVLPPAMPPPRDSAVPLPTLPELISIHQESILFNEEDFKCGAFCLSLPGFGKHKPVRSSPRRQDSMEKKRMRASSFTNSTISICASLEKFECGSWASTTALTQDNSRLFLDFPVEMMKRNEGGRDVQEPVTIGFLFDRETETSALRRVLKTRSFVSSGRDYRISDETSPQRRVRFSTSSSSASISCPTSPRSCITPRLRKAREDFNTLFAAHYA